MIKLKNLLLEVDDSYGQTTANGFPAPAPISLSSEIKTLLDSLIGTAQSYKDGVKNLVNTNKFNTELASPAYQNPIYILIAAAFNGNAGGFWSKILSRKARGNNAVIAKIFDKMPADQLYFDVNDTYDIPSPLQKGKNYNGGVSPDGGGGGGKPNVKFWSAPIIGSDFTADKGGSTVGDGYDEYQPESNYFTGPFSELIKYVNNYNLSQVWANKWNKGIPQLVLTTEMTNFADSNANGPYTEYNFVTIDIETSTSLTLYTIQGNQYNQLMMANSLNGLFLNQNVRTTGDSDQSSFGDKGKTKDYRKAVRTTTSSTDTPS